MARKLRIAVSGFFGLLTVALCVLWVRSYWRLESITRRDSSLTVFNSNNGYLFFAHINTPGIPGRENSNRWSIGVAAANRFVPLSLYHHDNEGSRLTIPHWMPALLFTTVTAIGARGLVGRFPSRFSLRTLLIATTLVAVVLGLAVWAGR